MKRQVALKKLLRFLGRLTGNKRLRLRLHPNRALIFLLDLDGERVFVLATIIDIIFLIKKISARLQI